MRPFVSVDNICAQNLLTIVSQGNAIIAEILRLKDHIPPEFLLNSKELLHKYHDNVLDFSYFKISDQHERKISAKSNVQDIDDELKEKYLELINRFYLAFESIHEYVTELNNFVEQLIDESFIQQTLDTVMYDSEGKQLMCESLYLYGCMLLLCDLYIPSVVRERILVAFYRYSTSQSQTHIDDVCKLLSETSFSRDNGKKPTDYPVHYFNRIQINPVFVENVISRLRSEDIYNQLKVYTQSEHRSTALATQASMLFVTLFFIPNILHNEATLMREFVDKFFPDNWVIPIYMGVSVSLVEMWDGFKAARNAVSNTCNIKTIKMVSEKYENKVKIVGKKIQKLLKEGKLTSDLVLDDISKILNLIKESNVCLRWFFLHTNQIMFFETNKKSKLNRETIIKENSVTQNVLLELLVSTAELELKVRDMLQTLLKERNENWNNYRKEAIDELESLADIFSGSKHFNKIRQNDQLKQWFENIAKQIQLLGEDINSKATKRIMHLIKALDEVEEFHELKSSSMVIQSLNDCKTALKNSLRTTALKEEYLINLEVVADLSYAWCSIDLYTKYMQESIKQNPSVTGRLRALFLKLASAMEIPLLRLNQAQSEDMESVTQYYSKELVLYVKKVLQIIPEMVFKILANIIELQTWSLKEIPTRLDKDKLIEYAQLEERMEVAELTHNASTFTKGILEMRSTLIGVVRIDPAQLLDDGLRSELSKNLIIKFDQLLDCKTKRTHNLNDFLNRLNNIADCMNGYKRSLEYIQDYINCHGLLIWQDEVSKIIFGSIEKEMDHRGIIQLHSPPITFIGNLSRELAMFTDSRLSTYMETKVAWCDVKTKEEIINLTTFVKLNEAIGPSGLHAIDKIYSCMIKHQITLTIQMIRGYLMSDRNIFTHDIENINQVVSKNSKKFSELNDVLLVIGNLQVLRKHLALRLNTESKFNCRNLEAALRTFNDSLLNDLKVDTKLGVKPSVPLELLQNLEEYQLRCGLYDPYKKIYVKNLDVHSKDDIIIQMATILVSQVGKLQFCPSTGDVIAKRTGDNSDGYTLAIGVYTILCQYGCGNIYGFVETMCTWIMSTTHTLLKSKSGDITVDVAIAYKLLQSICAFDKNTFEIIRNKIPTIVLATLNDFMKSQ